MKSKVKWAGGGNTGGQSATHTEGGVGVYFETLAQVSVIENSEGQTMAFGAAGLSLNPDPTILEL